MKNRTRLSVLLLVMCLLLCLAGCTGNIPQQSSAPESTAPPTTLPSTTAPPDPADIYTTAVDALGATVGTEIKISQTMTVAGQTFTSNCTQIVRLWNLGEDTFLAKAEDTTDYGDYEYNRREHFSNGAVYQTLNSCDFTAEMEAEDFLSRYPALQLLDPSLYTVTMDDDGRTIRFSDAAAIESWLADEDAIPVSVEATAVLDAGGKLTQCNYGAEYSYGPALYVTTYSITYKNPGDPDFLPTDISQYTTVEDIDGMWLMDHAYGYLLQAKQLSTTVLNSVQSQAAGLAVNRSMDINTFNKQSGFEYRLNSSVYAYSSAGNESFEVEEKYIDGKFTMSQDGGDPQPLNNVTQDIVEDYVLDSLSLPIFDTPYLADARITDLGSLYLIEYTGTEEMAISLCEDFSATYLGSANLLQGLASSYQTNQLDYYLALDKYTMLPTACGYLYEGCHTIEGQDCLLIDQYDQSYDLASLTAYEAIYEETSPDTEPEAMPTPLFYHVTGPEGEEMWLFGTIHVGDDRTAFLPQEIYDALLSSDALAVECDTDGFDKALETDEALQSQVSALYFYEEGTIADHIVTEGLHENAVKAMKATGNYFYNAEYQKASLWSSAIENFYLQQGHRLLSEKGLESRLEKLAEENDIPLWEVESTMSQIEMMTSYSDYLQEFMLYSSAHSHGKDNWEGTQELYELWCSGDESALIEEMKRESWAFTEEDLAEWEAEEGLEEEDLETIQYIRDNMESINTELEKIYQEYVKAMESDRNAGMLDVAKKYLDSGDTVFYAVGLAHLLAEDGLVFTLREAGYTVELVPYN